MTLIRLIRRQVFGQQLARASVHSKVPTDGGHRLKKPRLHYTAKPTALETEKVRNVALIAHIDAGKTTTTESMLYLAGVTNQMGNVDEGTTITDHMSLERQRGISIAASTISFGWRHGCINLIDTPGHVDFTVEVERSLRIVDGALVILDSSAGVEAQTMTVWHQCAHFNLPALVYVNKMDKPNADVDACLKSIREKMKATPMLINYPVQSSGSGQLQLVDLIHRRVGVWHSDDSTELTEAHFPQMAQSLREELLSQLAEWDSAMADTLLTSDATPTPEQIVDSVRRVVSRRLAVPVLFGSSIRSRGVSELLDALYYFMPSPREANVQVERLYGDHLCCLAFKIVHHPHLGCLTFVRVYNGRLSAGAKMFNLNRRCVETANRLYQPFGDLMNPVERACAGHIVVVGGLKMTTTGDTLTDRDVDVKQRDSGQLILAGIQPPDPVYRCIIEPSSPGLQSKLDGALNDLVREDPSLRTYVDDDSQETVLEGMGELHIEVVKDRLLNEYGLSVFMGPLLINYRETLSCVTQHEETIEQPFDGALKRVTVKLTVKPCPGSGALRDVQLAHVQGEKFLGDKYRDYIIDAVRDGCVNACMHGPLTYSRVQDVQIQLDHLEIDPKTPLAEIAACAGRCFHEAMKRARPILLEPYATVTLTVPEKCSHAVLSDLTMRNGQIENIEIDEEHWKHIRAVMPLSKMDNYASGFRSVTSGMGTFRVISVQYQPLDEESAKRVVAQVHFGSRVS